MLTRKYKKNIWKISKSSLSDIINKYECQGLIKKCVCNVYPILQRDGGDFELVHVSRDGVVSIKIQGVCRKCPGAMMTIKGVIEERLNMRLTNKF